MVHLEASIRLDHTWHSLTYKLCKSSSICISINIITCPLICESCTAEKKSKKNKLTSEYVAIILCTKADVLTVRVVKPVTSSFV